MSLTGSVTAKRAGATSRAGSGTARTKPAGTSGLRRHLRISSVRGRGATVTFVQLHGTGTQQIVRIIPKVDHKYMTDRALLTLYLSPEPEQMLGFGVGDVAGYGRVDQRPVTPL